MWQWILALLTVQGGLASGQQINSDAAPAFPTAICPLARFDLEANRYMVTPVTQRIRSVLELREKIPGQNPCTGPVVGPPDKENTFSFEASHFIPEKNAWEGVLTTEAEKLINTHLGRSKRRQIVQNMREAADAVHDEANEAEREAEEAAQDVVDEANGNSKRPEYEVCVVKTGVCVATLERPPRRSLFDRLGMFALRARAPIINSHISWMWVVVFSLVVAIIVKTASVHFFLAFLFKDVEDSDWTPREEDTAATEYASSVVPTSYDCVLEAVTSLGRMAVASVTLLVVCCGFLFKREANAVSSIILVYYPIVMMIAHLVVVLGSCFKALLYNSLLRDKLHIVFKGKNPRQLLTSPIWLVVFGATAIFLYTALMTLIADARSGGCLAQGEKTGDQCGPLQIAGYVALGFWSLLAPVAYCVWLIYTDFFFHDRFQPLYKFYTSDDAEKGKASTDVSLEAPTEAVKGAQSKAQKFCGDLKCVAYADFVDAAHLLKQEVGIYKVNAKAISKKLENMESHEKTEKDDGWESIGPEGKKTPRWVAGSLSLWSWRLRLHHSENKALELRLLLVVVSVAIAWTVLAAFGAAVYQQLCIPTLEEVTISTGQLSPAFDPTVFNYNIFVDTNVKSAGLQVISDKEFTSSTAFVLVGVNEEQQSDPWIKKSTNVHVPFCVRNAMLDKNASQAEELRDSLRAPVPIELHVKGAGTTLVYRITVVKLETRIESLTYKYNTSTSVDEVVVHKKIDWSEVVSSDSAGDEKDAFADENEGAAVYVPYDTKSVLIDMQRNLAIFGPTGGSIISGSEIADFEAVRKLELCPANRKGCEQKGEGSSQVELDDSVTALPVELRPNGTDPLRFFVSIIRISNRLINLDMEGAMGTRASSGAGWAGMSFLPAFRPLIDHYETFFEVPQARQQQHGGESDEFHTLFLRVMPQGNARSNWLEADLRANTPGDEDLELFCRPAAEDGADEPLDPTVEAETKDLSCGATDDEVAEAKNGNPTKDLIIRDTNGRQAFAGHFYVRYKYRLSNPKPFTLLLKVMFHEHIKGMGEIAPIGHRTYEVRFLPQAPMRLEFFAPLPSLEPPKALQEPDFGSAALMDMKAHSKRNLFLRSKQPEETKNFDLPVFLTPPFSSEVLVYDAMVPQGSSGSLLIRMTGSHSLWVGSGEQPLEGLGRGAALRQEVGIQRGPNCGSDAIFDSAAPSPAAPAGVALCPVSLRIFERRDGFPRSYGVRLREAPADTVLLVGFLDRQETGIINALPMPGFRPDVRATNSTFLDLDWHWAGQPSAPSPATFSAADTDAAAAADTDSSGKQPSEELSDEVNAEQAAQNLNDVIQPQVQPQGIVPREEPTAAPVFRKMDEAPLLPFFLQTASASHEPDEAPLFPNFEALIVAAAGPAPAPAKAVAPTDSPPPPPSNPTAWETGEPVPASTLAVLAGSPRANVRVQWNHADLPMRNREGAWSLLQMSGKLLVEGCWCDRKQLGNTCKERLRKGAPEAFKQYYRPSACLLSVSVNGKLRHEIQVGLAGGASPALQERALEEAADAASLVNVQVARVGPQSAAPELLVQP